MPSTKERMSESRMQEVALAFMRGEDSERYALLPKITSGSPGEIALNLSRFELFSQGIEVSGDLRGRIIKRAETAKIPIDDALEFTRLCIIEMANAVLASSEEVASLKL